jgi:RNA polymerase sigma factor (sigma-70 family)
MYREAHPSLADDLESAAMLALCDAARRWSAERGVKWATYLSLKVRWACLDCLREELPCGFRGKDVRRNGGTVVPPRTLQLAGAGGWIPGREPEPGEAADEARDLRRWLGHLTRQQAAVCRLVCVEGYTQLEAGRRLRLSQSRVHFLINEAAAVLRSLVASGAMSVPRGWTPAA